MDSIQIKQLLKQVQKGDEVALDKLHTIIDELANINIKLTAKLARIKTITREID